MSIKNDIFAEVGYTNSKGEEISKEERDKELQEIREKETEKELNELRSEIGIYIKNQASYSKNYFLAFLCSLAGTLLVTIPWGIIEGKGYFAAWFSFIAIAVASKLYDKTRTKSNAIKALCVFFATLIATFFEQFVSSFSASVLFSAESKTLGISKAASLYFGDFCKMVEINMENLVIGVVFTCIGSFFCLRGILHKNRTADHYREMELD